MYLLLILVDSNSYHKAPFSDVKQHMYSDNIFDHTSAPHSNHLNSPKCLYLAGDGPHRGWRKNPRIPITVPVSSPKAVVELLELKHASGVRRRPRTRARLGNRKINSPYLWPSSNLCIQCGNRLIFIGPLS